MTLSTEDRLNELFRKYVDGEITEKEHAELFFYIRNPETKERVLAFMDEQNKKVHSDKHVHEIDWDSMYASITGEHHKNDNKGFMGWRYMVAAVMFMVGGFALYYLSLKDDKSTEPLVYHNDVLPGGNKAVLVLADGSKINLDNRVNGTVATQGNIAIERDAQGQIVYKVGTKGVEDSEQINTLSTPIGGTFSVVLSDGSKVWLNAASSLKFPAKFAGAERRVEVFGEAYFEIAKDRKRPFLVKNGSSEIKVLGTHFNVMAYPNEYQSILTLLEGSVQFAKGKHTELLSPGKQLLYEESSTVTKQVDANIEEVMAWRNNLFVFNNTSLNEIMKDLERWYDVKIKYEGEKPDLFFTGVIPRTANVSKVLKTLELTGDIVFGLKDNVITCEKKKMKK
ncbi:FecR family protein [Pedobacter sp. UBA4863]|uniref:FecR family protein n=1 Tax=Pedobacter sp. UBA4863 TaxID=1947060 RepID=UPI0025D609A2|nr:FecR family protein [Pedobacter sp. UBA4863]